MTPDRAHFLGATAQAFHGEGLDFMGIAPLDLLALLAERERLRGALESIRDIAGAPSDRDPDYSRLDRIDAIARQALEASHDQ